MKATVIVTDAHVSVENGNHTPFFEMLECLGRTEHDVIFLGDVFDLWIACPGYEEPIHHRFIQWCRHQKACRFIGFVEGNHEFYVVSRHVESFSASSDRALRLEGGTLLVHGDLINRADTSYLRFRRLTKNAVVKVGLRLVPFGSHLAHYVRKKLKKTNRTFKMFFPEKEVCRMAEHEFSGGTRRILLGHFHRHFVYQPAEDRRLEVIPDWYATEKIAMMDDSSIRIIHWRELKS